MVVQLTTPIIRNIKLRLTVAFPALKKLRDRIKIIEEIEQLHNPSYYIFQRNRNYIAIKNILFFTIWERVGRINITGIKSIAGIPSALTEFSKQFNILETEILQVTIDNIFASGSLNRRINLRILKELINSEKPSPHDVFQFTCEFNPEKFPAAYCRSRSINSQTIKPGCVKKRGTVVVFGSGKFNILGAKCVQDVTTLTQDLIALIYKL
jgi:TATA-box binding protein (TBP) (component of TFIID and TFIIIB)